MISVPKYIKYLDIQINEQLKCLKKSNSKLLEVQQSEYDQVLEIHQKAFKTLIDYSVTYSGILDKIKQAYDHALKVRNERISQFIIQDVSTIS
ncbi:hypothetical protein HF086_006182 [Spodoptera exigua]|uniref:Translin-associated factor X-interacting protein 1 N-terminal domain-containing protein n=1 Tax=Spodoptera exigua TaxID=7107 RepID=A0A922MCV0_SPOEX|nr:hypothetical protein HF086_006182 [Spodoptera exigua]